MCAECHSTGVRKNYDAATTTFDTTWAEISVGCEACHGQGSRHVAWARDQQSWWPFAQGRGSGEGTAVRFDERDDVAWRPDPTDRQSAAQLRRRRCCARRSRPAAFATRAAASFPRIGCRDGRCRIPTSSRRSAAGLYHADGQMLDEVYNYGSFKQSKMFAAGVTCSDCHEPHAPSYGCRATASACNATPRTNTRRQRITITTASNPPLACASCHMPASTYMVVDRRHDHSFRIPRPDLSVKLGTPNACNDCHADKSAQWAADAIESWHGPDRKGFQNYAAGIPRRMDGPGGRRGASRRGGVGSQRAGIRSRQCFDRACLARFAGEHRVSRAARFPIPIRWCGSARLTCWKLAAGADLAAGLAAPLGFHSGRASAAQSRCSRRCRPQTSPRPTANASSVPPMSSSPPSALTPIGPRRAPTLGNFYARRGRTAEAEAEYKAALRLSPQFAPAAINLADLYRQIGRDGEGENVLRTAIASSPQRCGLCITRSVSRSRG